MQCQHRGALAAAPAAGRLSCCCSSCSSSPSSPWLFQALWLFSWLLSFHHISSSLCWSLAPRFHSSLQIKSGFLPLPDASGFWFMLSLTFVRSQEIQDHCWNILFISPLKELCSCLAGFLIFSNLSYLLVLLTLCVWNTLLLLCFFSHDLVFKSVPPYSNTGTTLCKSVLLPYLYLFRSTQHHATCLAPFLSWPLDII